MTRSQTLAGRRHLAQYATGLVTEQSKAGLVGDLEHLTGAPVTVDSDRFEYKKYDADAGIRLVDTKKSDDDPEGIEIDFGGTLITDVLDTRGAHSKPYRVDGVSDDVVWLRVQETAQMGSNVMLLSRLNDAITQINTLATAPTAIDLTSATEEVVALLQTQIDNVRLACAGYCNIHLLWGNNAYNKVANHAKVQARINGGATRDNPSTVTLAQMDALLGKGTNSRLSNAVYTSSKKGAEVTNAFLLANVVYIAAVSPTPSRMDPGAVKLFKGLGDPMTPKFYRTDDTGTHEKCKWDWKEKPKVTNAAALIKQAFTV